MNTRKKKILAKTILVLIIIIPLLTVSLNFSDNGESNDLLTDYKPHSDDNSICTSQGGGVWWNNNWRYRVPINISASEVLTDYQVEININLTEWYEKGYLDESGKDIRFANYSGTELDFWIEKMDVSGQNSTIWVKVPNISDSETETIYMYFGNTEAETVSSIDDTMDSGLRYFYYDDTSLENFEGTDVYGSAPNFEWDSGTVVINSGNSWEDESETVSIRWKGWIKNEGDGNHRFWIYTDDGSRLFLNDTIVIDEWNPQAPTEHDDYYDFSSIVPIKYEWYEQSGRAWSKLGWTPPGGSKVYPIPGSNLWNRKYAATEPTVSIGEAEPGIGSVKINTFDLYGYSVTDANVSVYNYTDSNSYLTSGLTDDSGSILFEDLGFLPLNLTFNVSLTSSSGLTKIINTTSEPISIETIPVGQTYKEINLTCNASTHILSIKDVDGVPVDSAWVEVGNSSHPFIQNCSINSIGNATFTWVNDTSNYNYNYTVYYRDESYSYPSNPLVLATGNFTDPTIRYPTPIPLEVNLTTIDFSVYPISSPTSPVGNVLLEFSENGTGNTIAELITDTSGQATLRWLTTEELSTYSGANGNYSLKVFFGGQKEFGVNSTAPIFSSYDFNFSAHSDIDIYLNENPEDFQTTLQTLNPTQYPSIPHGAQLKIRVLFNISKYNGSTSHEYVGPNTTDSISYSVIGKGVDFSGSLLADTDMGIGFYYAIIDTSVRNMAPSSYNIEITASKNQYQSPTPLTLDLTVEKNELTLNQSENDDSLTSTYWNDDINMSVKPYGLHTESFTIEDTIYENDNYNFQISIPDAENVWNLTEIKFDIYNWSGIGIFDTDQELNITDPWGTKHLFDDDDGLNWAGEGNPNSYWSDVVISSENLNKNIRDNIFDFIIEGTFNYSINITAQAKFVRDRIDAQYTKTNITDSISIPYDGNGWVINNITFNIYNCKDSSDWSDVDPGVEDLKILAHQNFTSTDIFTYSVINSGSGYGQVILDNVSLYPYNGAFDFSIISNNDDLIFDTNMSIEYIQYFYEYYQLENATVIKSTDGINNGGSFQIDPEDPGWTESQAPILYIENIYNGSDYFLPSELDMNITIGTQQLSVADSAAGGYFLLNQLSQFSKNTLYDVSIETSQPVNYTISYEVEYIRSVYEDLKDDISSISYEVGTLSGSALYDSNQEYWRQTINTTELEVRTYTVSFTATKQYYTEATKDLELEILARPTILNGSLQLQYTPWLYINQAYNFTLEYNGTLEETRIGNLETAYFNWYRVENGQEQTPDKQGTVEGEDYGVGYLIEKIETDGPVYILDFNTSTREVGDYSLWAYLQKDNYETRIAHYSLTIKKRIFTVIPLITTTSFDYGDKINFQIQIIDPTYNDRPLSNATVLLTVGGSSYPLQEVANGIYQLAIPTDQFDAFFSDATIKCSLRVEKDNYVSQSFDFNVVVNMQELFEGVPLFYFILGVSIAATVIAAVSIYRYVQLAKIPEFVKKTQKIKKQIKAQEAISEEHLYPSKEEFMAEKYGDEWKELGLSIDDSLGLEKKGGKKGPSKPTPGGGAQ
jgi:hypothetical protein